jgi:branched-chain amino acid transport system permease protein
MKKRFLIPLIIVTLLILLVVPNWIDNYWLQMLIYILWMIYLASCWNLVLYGGLFSLMHGVFVGAGAYTTTLLWLNFGISPWVGMLAGVLVAVVLAIISGRFILNERVPLLAFAAITLALSFIGTFVANGLLLTGGSGGLANNFNKDNPWNFQWVGDKPYYYIILIMVAAAVINSHIIFHSRLGLYLRAGAENPRVASSSGVDVFRTRILILVISAAMTSLGGAFWAQYANYIDPMHIIGPMTTVSIAMLVLIGGIGSIWGPVLGPAVMIPISWVLGARLGGKFSGIDMLIYGVVIILIFRFSGKGFIPWCKDRLHSKQPSGAAAGAKSGVEKQGTA